MAALMLVSVTAVSAQSPETLIAACDGAAASAVDEDLPEGVTPVPFEAIDPPTAMDLCTRAVAAAPDDLRMQYNLGRALDAADEDGRALAVLIAAGEAGYPAAMRGAGVLFAEGASGSPDMEAAGAWWRRAIDAGSISAMTDLAEAYIDGTLTPPTPFRGIELMEKAAEAGSTYAHGFLGWLYATGIDGLVGRDEARAVTHLLAAADVGDAYASGILGRATRVGDLGLPVDYEAARRWLEVAAAQEPQSVLTLAHMDFAGEGLPAPDREAGLLRLDGLAGSITDPDERLAIGENFEFGSNGIPENLELAAVWYQLAADDGSSDGAVRLGRLYLVAPDSAPSPVAAAFAFERAYELDPSKSYAIGSLYEGMEQYEAALGWYEQGAETDVEAAVRAGVFHLTGIGTQRDATRADTLFETALAIDPGPDTMIGIATAILFGLDESVYPDTATIALARSWLERARDAGSADAEDYLAYLDGLADNAD